MSQKQIIKFIQAYFKNETLNELPSHELLNSLQEQCLLQYLYPVYQNDSFKSLYYSAVISQEKFRRLQNQITQIFNENKINHFYIKGSFLHNIYPDIALRMRGDIDLFVEEEQLSLANEILKTSGFLPIDEDCMHHLAYKKDGLLVELHFSLLDNDGDAYYNYFKNPFDFCEKYDKNLYYLKHEQHFVYCMCHLIKHIKTDVGIRFLFDFYYMIKNWKMNFALLHSIIDKLNLKLFYQNIINALTVLTGEKLDDVPNGDVDYFIDYFLTIGVHQNSNQSLEEKFLRQRNHKLKFFFAKVFMINKAYRISLYPRLGKHWFFYSICLLHHIFYLLTHRLSFFFKFLFKPKTVEDKKREEIYKKMGIK